MNTKTEAAVIVLFLCGVTLAFPDGLQRPGKLIETGWDMPDSVQVRENLEAMERQPFDGVVLGLAGKTDEGKKCLLRASFADAEWKEAWFKACVDDLKACKFRRFTDNFALVGANPGDVDWFDDKGWENIVDHWRIAARIVRQSGLKGILFDPEPYTPPHSQFSYNAQPQKKDHKFDDYCGKARQRGREVINAVARECPDVVLFCYFMNSVCGHAISQADAQAILQRNGYGLLPAFVDGWLDGALPSMVFVDGCESAYRYNSPIEYLEAGNLIRNTCQALVSPANRAKYRAQVQASFGIYMDAYWNPPTSPWYIDGLGGPRVERLRKNVKTALRVADEYVWVYGEKNRWWPTRNGSVNKETWDEALPGCEKALALSRDPVAWASAKMAEMKGKGSLVNLARNGGFSEEKCQNAHGGEDTWKEGHPPAGWSSWQDKSSRGNFLWDRETGLSAKGSAKSGSSKNGCFIQGCEVKPGEVYFVSAWECTQGSGSVHLRVRWQSPEGKWIHENLDSILVPGRTADKSWYEMSDVVEVPDGAGKLLILLGVNDQVTAEDVAWFDDIQLYKLD